MYKGIEKAVGKLSIHERILLDKKKYFNKAFLYAIAISTDRTGKIEKINYSNKTTELDSIVVFSRLSALIRDQQKLISAYRNQILLITVLMRMQEDRMIDNVKEFESSFRNLYSLITKAKGGKTVTVLPPIYCGFYPVTYH